MKKCNKIYFYSFIISLIFISGNQVRAQSLADISDLIIDKSFRIYPSNVTQSETFIVNHPTNQNILFASAYTIVPNPFFISEGVYVSTNSGESWYGSDTCSGFPIQFHGGEPAITIDKDGTFILNRLGRQPTFIGLYSHYSADNGISWSSQLTITTDDLEKHSIGSDVFNQSPFYGRTYAAYTMLTPPYDVRATYTNDGGKNWTAPFSVNNPAVRCYGTDLTVKQNGEVYLCWAVIPINITSPYEVFIGFASSNNGGNSWSVQENAIPTRGITGILSQKQNIRVNSTPRIAVDNTSSQYNGTIYIVTSQKELAPAGNDPDIVLFKSTDNGFTWSSGIRVNQDAINNGKIQFFPAINIDPYGGINILYLDDRNTTSDSTGVFLSRSLDGGETWIDYQVSDHNFQPIAVSGLGAGNVSDHIDLTFSNGKLWPVWMDNSTGIYQVWTAPISFTPDGIESELQSVNEFKLHQNYPNPFNTVTRIRFSVPSTPLSIAESSGVKLTIFDILGNEVITLIDEEKQHGTYEVEFDAANLPGNKKSLSSGIYFYRLIVNNFSETKSMLFIK